MRPLLIPAALAALLLGPAAEAKLIFTDGFESLHERWAKNIDGKGSIDIVDGGVEGKCLRIEADGGRVYLTTKLDAERLRGATVVVSGMVKLIDARQGPQVYSTPKFHTAQRVPGMEGVINTAERWTGTFDWERKQMVVNVHEECTELVLDLGNQNGFGVMLVDNLVVEDNYGLGRPVDILAACNTGRSDGVAGDGAGSFIDTGALDLYHLPEGRIDTQGLPSVYVPADGLNGGRTVIALRGRERPELPEATEPIALDRPVAALALLQAAAWAKVAEREPVLALEVTYADGQTATQELRAGVDLGNFDDPQPYENWRLAWSGRSAAGTTVGAGVALWHNPRPDAPIKSLRLISAGNGVPIVLAITALRPQDLE